VLLDEKNQPPEDAVTRQTVFPTSSAINSAPFLCE
jgi:hypothetical protein